MFLCCQLTYLKYINEDDTIDFSVIEKYYDDAGIEELVKSIREDFICKCVCHKKGHDALH